MNGIDIAILSIMGISCLMGIIRGFTKEILGLFTWAGSAFAAYITYPLASELTRGYIANPMIADGVSGVALFILFLIIFSIITFNISNAVRASAVGGLDRGLGLAFGVVRGSVLICAAEIAFSLFIGRDAQSESMQSARFVPMVRRGADELLLMMPTQWREMMDQQSKALQGIGKGAALPATQLLTPVLPLGAPSSSATPVPSPNQAVLTPAPGVVTPGAAATGEAPQSSMPSQTLLPNSALQPQVSAQTARASVLGSASHNVTPMDRDKAADSLSDLKPMAADIKGSEGIYDKRQQRELDRLIEASE